MSYSEAETFSRRLAVARDARDLSALNHLYHEAHAIGRHHVSAANHALVRARAWHERAHAELSDGCACNLPGELCGTARTLIAAREQADELTLCRAGEHLDSEDGQCLICGAVLIEAAA